ncbi:hypothetical protein [Streptomyces olivochromogenes]|uniref:hypothetical protein n=1 Tax=Streptomyces olivochromogenes TaxID=1963 RepID=UPI00367C9600
MAVTRYDAGAFTWPKFQAALISRIDAWEASAERDEPYNYYGSGWPPWRMCSRASAPCPRTRSPHAPKPWPNAPRATTTVTTPTVTTPTSTTTAGCRDRPLLRGQPGGAGHTGGRGRRRRRNAQLVGFHRSVPSEVPPEARSRTADAALPAAPVEPGYR